MAWTVYSAESYDNQFDPRDILASRSDYVNREIDVENVDEELEIIFSVLGDHGLSDLTEYELNGSGVYSARYNDKVKIITETETEQLPQELQGFEKEVEVSF